MIPFEQNEEVEADMFKMFKRYSVVGVLVFLCFFSAFLALCNGLLSTSKASSLIRERNQYAYSSELRVFISSSESISSEILFQLVDSVEQSNIYIEDMRIYFDEVEGLFKPKVILKQNESLSLPTEKNIDALPENSIVISSNIIGELNALSVHGERFNIYNKIDSDRYPYATGIIINAKDYFRACPDALDGVMDISLTIAASKANVYTAYEQIKEKAKEISSNLNIFSSEVKTTQDVFTVSLTSENLISIGLFLFALINTLIISYYWVVVRRHEIAIRKAFGASNIRIIKLMMSELAQIISLSAIVAILVQCIIWKLKGDNIVLSDSIFLMVGLLLSIAIASFVVMIVPVRIILNIQPSEGVKL